MSRGLWFIVQGGKPVILYRCETLIRDHDHILARWAEHLSWTWSQWYQMMPFLGFCKVLSLRSWTTALSVTEITRAIKQMSSGKAAPADKIPPEVFSSKPSLMYCKRSGKVCKSGGNFVATRLTQLQITIWNTDLIFFLFIWFI